MKKLTKSKDNTILSGVLAGIAEYFEIDVTIVRLVFVLLAAGSFGSFAILYFICSFIMPEG